MLWIFIIKEFAKKITLNDKDRAIYVFWHAVLNETKELCSLIGDSDVLSLRLAIFLEDKFWFYDRAVTFGKSKGKCAYFVNSDTSACDSFAHALG